MYSLTLAITLSTISVSAPINNASKFSILENQNQEYYEEIKETRYI